MPCSSTKSAPTSPVIYAIDQLAFAQHPPPRACCRKGGNTLLKLYYLRHYCAGTFQPQLCKMLSQQWLKPLLTSQAQDLHCCLHY